MLVGPHLLSLSSPGKSMEESSIEKSHKILETTSSCLIGISAVRQMGVVNLGEGSAGAHHSNLVSMRSQGDTWGVWLVHQAIIYPNQEISLCLQSLFQSPLPCLHLLVLNQWF